MADPVAGAASLTFVGTATTVVRLGRFTLLTDPNFLREGQRAYLGKGLWSRRLTEPALGVGDLPALSAVVLSHLHGDHFDRVARRELDRTPPVLTTPHAAQRLRRWGFAPQGLETWQRHTLRKGDEQLVVESLPAVHARGLLGRLLPPVMGTLLEHSRAGTVTRRVYVSGDTLTGDHIDEIRQRHPHIDAAVVHLGGTRVLFRTVTLDGPAGIDLVRRCEPSVVVPVHHDDYGVFRSPLSDFLMSARADGRAATIRAPRRGESVSLDPPAKDTSQSS
jgi:L-ascorbate metabolism protein UlaG (beta-lactamase superfamily)